MEPRTQYARGAQAAAFGAALESFCVVDADGPLKDSDLERVAAWAADLAERTVTTAAG